MYLKNGFLIVTLLFFLWTQYSYAMGRRVGNLCYSLDAMCQSLGYEKSEDTLKIASPLVHVLLKPVITHSFYLPNGVEIDMQSELQAILNTVVTSTSVFSPTESILKPENPRGCPEILKILPKIIKCV